MRPGRLVGVVAAVLAFGVAGCGGRTPLSDPWVGTPGDAGLADGLLPDSPGTTRDAPLPDLPAPADRPPPDVAIDTSPDLPPEDGGPARCTVGEVVPVAELRGGGERVAYPALARGIDGRLLLVYTDRDPGSAPGLFSVTLDASGQPVGSTQEVGRGEGGTVVPADALGTPFLLAHASNDGHINIVPLDADGASQGANVLPIRTNNPLHPGLVIGENLLGLAWDDLMTGNGMAMLSPISGGTGAAQVAVNGRLAWLALVPGTADRAYVLGVGQTGVTVDQYDTGGTLHGSRSVGFPGPSTSPPSIVAQVVDSPGGGVAMAGGDPGSNEASIYLDLGEPGTEGQAATTQLRNQLVLGLGAAYDAASGFVLAAARAYDLGTGNAPVTLLALSARGHTTVQVPGAEPVNTTESAPAVAATGTTGGFLVVWDSLLLGGPGVVQAAPVTCQEVPD